MLRIDIGEPVCRFPLLRRHRPLVANPAPVRVYVGLDLLRRLAAYAAGMFDALALPVAGDPDGIALAAALTRCAVDLKLTSALVAEAMTRYWEQHSDRWGDPAGVVFYVSVAQSACLKHVNEERRKAGLVEWPKH